jgi:hypothetical protein
VRKRVLNSRARSESSLIGCFAEKLIIGAENLVKITAWRLKTTVYSA